MPIRKYSGSRQLFSKIPITVHMQFKRDNENVQNLYESSTGPWSQPRLHSYHQRPHLSASSLEDAELYHL